MKLSLLNGKDTLYTTLLHDEQTSHRNANPPLPAYFSLTPVETILKAYQVFLEDTTGMAGETLECSANKLIYYNMPEYGNGPITKRAITVWEPLFRMMHGEDSRLPDAIP